MNMEGANFTCNFCNKKVDGKLKRCAKCKTVYYCCREHQVKDWSSHKTSCHAPATKPEVPEQVEPNTPLGAKPCEDQSIAFDQRPIQKQNFNKPPSYELFQLSKFAAKYLKKHGYCVIDDVVNSNLLDLVLKEICRMNEIGIMHSGMLAGGKTSGKDSEKVLNHSIRSDKIAWIEGTSEDVENFPNICSLVGETMDNLVAGLNAFLDDGLVLSGRTKVMAACYPGNGAAYKRHVDNPNKDGRLVTCIVYLNKNWDVEKSGGVLRMFPQNKNACVDIEPIFNRMILFWSDHRNPHEVHPAYDTRYAITVWYFEKEERAKAREVETREDLKNLQSDIALMDVKVKQVQKETVEKKIENESMKALNSLSESELTAICELVGNHPEPKKVLAQFKLAPSIQDLLVEEIFRRKKLKGK